MATYNPSNKRTRPNYGDRRTRGANTDISSESVQHESAPRELDIILDTSRQEGNSITIGHPRSAHDRPALLLGKVGHSEHVISVEGSSETRYMDSLRGGPSRLAATLLLGGNNLPTSRPVNQVSQLSFTTGDGLTGITAVSSGLRLHDYLVNLHAFPCGDNSLVHPGENDTDYVGAKALIHGVMPGPIANDGLVPFQRGHDANTLTRINTGITRSGNEMQLNSARANPQSLPHFLMTGISPRTGNRRTSVFHTSTDMSRPYNTYDSTLHGNLARQAILTPDEYVIRNIEGLRDLIQRLPYFLKNDVVGSFQKGGRSGWWTRASNATLSIMGEMGHLGMSLRLGMPVQNAYAFTSAGLTPTQTDETAETSDDAAAAATGGTDDDTSGSSSATTTLGDLDDDGVLNDAIATALRAENEIAINLVGYNMSINPLFMHFIDGVHTDSTDPAERGIFIGGNAIQCAISPGIVEDAPLMPEDRDPSTNDIIIGLNWVFQHLGSEMGAHWASISLPCMEVFEDIKNGKVVDLAANSSRTSSAALRSAFHMGLTNVESVIAGVQPPGNTANLARFHGAGFINQAEVAQFTDDMNDLSLRSYMLGPRFAQGQARHGDARSSVTHDYLATGAIRQVDVRLTPVAFGHWGVRSSVGWTNTLLSNDGTPWASADLQNALFTATGYVGANSARLRDDCTAESGNILGLDAGTVSRDVLMVGLLNYLMRVTELESYSVHTNAIGWVGSRAHGFTWDSFSGDVLANVHEHTQMVSPSGAVQRNRSMFDDEYVNFQPGNVFGRWCAEFDRLFKLVASTKSIEHYQSPTDLEQGTAVNLAKELTNRTGDPALQRFLSGFIIACAQGYTNSVGDGTAEIRNIYTIDRQLHNRDIHGSRVFRGDANVDLFPMLLPSSVSGEFAMIMGTHRVMLDRLGLVGSGRQDESFTISQAQFRTIFDTPNDQAWTGEIMSYTIDTNYDYELSRPGPHVTQSGGAYTLSTWSEFLPHFQMLRRLIPAIGGTVDSLGVFGMLEDATAAGSTVAGLNGYTTTVSDAVVEALQMRDLSSNALLTTPTFDLTVLEDLLAVVKGTVVNREFEAADVAFVFVDQDAFDVESSRLAVMRNDVENIIPVGPIPLLLVYSKDGALIQASDSIDTQSAVSNAPMAPAEPQPTSEEVDAVVEEVVE